MRRLVEQHALAGAQDGAVPPRQRPFLVAQHDVAVVRAIGHEERDQAAARPFLLRAVGIALGDGGFVERPSGDRRRVLQQPAHRRANVQPSAPRKSPRACVSQVDPFEIGIARCLRVIGLEQAEERPCGLRPGLQRDRRRLDHRAGDLVLQPFARQVAPGLDPAGVAVATARAAASHRWRRPTAPSRQPCATHGCAAALREVLAAHHHRAAARDGGRCGGRCTATRRPRCS